MSVCLLVVLYSECEEQSVNTVCLRQIHLDKWGQIFCQFKRQSFNEKLKLKNSDNITT